MENMARLSQEAMAQSQAAVAEQSKASQAAAAAQNAAMLQVMEKLCAEKDAARSDSERRSQDKGDEVGITGLKLDLTIPQIHDNNHDFATHWTELRGIMASRSSGRGDVRPHDQMTMFRRSLPANSVRLQVYDTAVKRAYVEKRLPDNPGAVLKDILVEMGALFEETDFQRDERVEKEFETLEMGRMPFAQFHAKWDKALLEVEIAKLSIAGARRIFLGSIFQSSLLSLDRECCTKHGPSMVL